MIGTLALIVNVVIALMLFRYRDGFTNMRSVWICSRNEVIGNLAVLGAAFGVFEIGQSWPDLLVATGMAGLDFWGATEVFGRARRELAHQWPSPFGSNRLVGLTGEPARSRRNERIRLLRPDGRIDIVRRPLGLPSRQGSLLRSPHQRTPAHRGPAPSCSHDPILAE
tara:strand:- start:44293 stop:44793 length:501 start_codon:yes stop_codon:yes gene_type:complete